MDGSFWCAERRGRNTHILGIRAYLYICLVGGRVFNYVHNAWAPSVVHMRPPRWCPGCDKKEGVNSETRQEGSTPC